jgi:hypothetical protein
MTDSTTGTPARRSYLFGLPAIFISIIFGSCSALYPVQVQKIAGADGPARNTEDIELLRDPPSRAYMEIARLSTESINYDNPGHAVARLRTVAADLGADALILEKRGVRQAAGAGSAGRVDGDFGFGPPMGGPAEPPPGVYHLASYASGTAIRWLEAESRPATAR